MTLLVFSPPGARPGWNLDACSWNPCQRLACKIHSYLATSCSPLSGSERMLRGTMQSSQHQVVKSSGSSSSSVQTAWLCPWLTGEGEKCTEGTRVSGSHSGHSHRHYLQPEKGQASLSCTKTDLCLSVSGWAVSEENRPWEISL